MENVKNLQSAKSLADVATLLGFKPKALSYLLYAMPKEIRYSAFEIPKKNGGTRKIYAPCPQLKNLQRRLADYLLLCSDEIDAFLGRGRGGKNADRISHGFEPERSILTNAREHRHRRFVFNVDLDNFFGLITFPRVRGYFLKNRYFSLNERVATVLAQIACSESGLPQGSPCSPVVSNLIGHILDMELVELASMYGCTYTRYADDLTFSTNKKDFPSEIAIQDVDGGKGWVAGAELSKRIARSQFAINASKTRMQLYTSRQMVTGLLVNKKVNVRPEYRRRTRAMIHSLVSKGSFYLTAKETDKYGKTIKPEILGRPAQLHGRLGFIRQVDRATGAPTTYGDSRSPSGRELMYRQFLMYKEFYATQAPVIICEGPTDNIYLTNAIWRLSEQFPSLMSPVANGGKKIGVRRFNYVETDRGSILGIGGGADQLRQFIINYRDALNLFKAKTSQFPAIILIDNDRGAAGIFGICRDIGKVVNPKAAEFSHVCGNLYVVATPLGEKAESCIEDLFGQDALTVELEGRVFTKSNEFDSTKFYGKMAFANEVVKRRSADLDFSGFTPLLKAIEGVIAHNAARLASRPN